MPLFSRSNQVITISTRTIVKFIVFTVIALVALQAIGSIGHQLRLIFISLFLAIGLNPAVNFFTKRIKSKSRLRATGFAYIIVIGALIGFLSIVVPPLVKQTSEFVSGVPETLNNLKNQDTAIARGIRRYQLEDDIDQLRQNYAARTGDLAQPVISTAGRIGSTVVSIITVLILTFMMLVEGPMWFEKIMAMQPETVRKKRRAVLKKMYNVITGFFNGQMLIAFISATFTAIMLFILNSIFNTSVNPIALAGIVFLFGLLPLIGNIIAAGIVFFICVISSVPLALVMLGYFIIYQQIENATLQPYIQSRNNQLTPLIVFVSALIGAGLAGILGALAAIPVAGCIKIILDEYVRGKFPGLEAFNEHNKSTK